MGFGYNTKDRSHIYLSLFINDLAFLWISMRFQLDFELRLSLLPIVFGIYLRKTSSNLFRDQVRFDYETINIPHICNLFSSNRCLSCVGTS